MSKSLKDIRNAPSFTKLRRAYQAYWRDLHYRSKYICKYERSAVRRRMRLMDESPETYLDTWKRIDSDNRHVARLKRLTEAVVAEIGVEI